MAATQHAHALRNDSQAYLTTALLQLLEKQPLNEIKVTTLVTRAGVSRMAFYRNYQSLEDILKAYFAPQITHLFDLVIAHQSAEVKRQEMQSFFTVFAADLKLATQRNYEYVIRDLFTANMARYYADWPGMPATTRRYWTVFMTNGVYGIWREWLLSGQHESLIAQHQLIKALQEATAAALVQPLPE
ncbi:MAG: TetR/AcrR family transcriptional regulator [Lactobacillus sp.]|jgi:AcrR family transcriptional regulator|nr:TetR/AcrR family transcriptional regulator [Lactobacillus sp.]MCI2033206.1 TetR/AcrR family transcriptional regulator [Lactobacillus sp.]